MTARSALAACLALVAACSAGENPAHDAAAALDLGAGDGAAAQSLCCSPTRCAQVGQRCNAQTCRCELIPCPTAGEPCDASLLPGIRRELICGVAPGGSFCFIRVDAPGDCPPGASFCHLDAAGGCLCGVGCRFFFDDCPSGSACYSRDALVAVGSCVTLDGSVGVRRDGHPCDSQFECATQRVCTRDRSMQRSWQQMTVCTQVDCGLAEGAPACLPGWDCLPLDSFGMLGVCRKRCEPFQIGSCEPNEACLWEGEPAASPARCWGFGSLPLPRQNAPCADACAAGLACVDGLCLEMCDREAAAATTAGCASGSSCLSLDGRAAVPPAGGRIGACTRRCDPWSTAKAGCDTRSYCAVSFEGQDVFGLCLPRGPDHLGDGEPCIAPCDSSLVCSGGLFPRCRPACRPGAAAGTPGACAAGERCFTLTDPSGLGQLPYGFCARPCTPGGGDCARGVWCEPRELDSTTGHWVGTCDEAD